MPISTHIQRAFINSQFHMYPCVKIVDKSLGYIEKYPLISIVLENPIEKTLEVSCRADHANPASITEISLLFLQKGDLIDIIVNGDYPPLVLKECADGLQELLEYPWEVPAGNILCKKKQVF